MSSIAWSNLLERLIKKSRLLIPLNEGKSSHFSYLVRKNGIISIGLNNRVKTHTMCSKWGYPYERIHSEVSAICSMPYGTNVEKCRLVNIRLNKNGVVLGSRPCKFCQALLREYRPKEVWFTTDAGDFECL